MKNEINRALVAEKKMILFATALMVAGCGFLKNSTSSNSSQQTTASTQQTTVQSANTAISAGQGAGNNLLSLYNQYKADGNKFDYKNMNNILNTVSLVANCEGLKDNFKNTTYLKEFGKGVISSSLGLVTQDNVTSVTNSLVNMVTSSEAAQQATTTVQNSANTAAGYANTAASYANTAATYASSISSLLSLFGK